MSLNSTASQSTLDPLIPKSLMDSIKSAFSVQASTPIEVTGIGAAQPAEPSGIAIAAAIGLKSQKYVGTLALCFPATTFLGVINRMLGEKYSAIDLENADAAGELLNIIYASARVKINEGGHEFLPAIPTVIHGEKIGISHGATPMVIKMDCKCEFGIFHLEISLRKNGS